MPRSAVLFLAFTLHIPSICGSIKTLSDTNTEVLANSAHSDSQRIHASERVSQSLPSVDFVAPLTLMVLAYNVAIAWRESVHAVVQTFQILLVNLQVWMEWQGNVLI
jgi:hypothetical protein